MTRMRGPAMTRMTQEGSRTLTTRTPGLGFMVGRLVERSVAVTRKLRPAFSAQLLKRSESCRPQSTVCFTVPCCMVVVVVNGEWCITCGVEVACGAKVALA